MTYNTASKNCDVTPDISLMKKMANIYGTSSSRLMELVDNSIDARLPSQVLEIDVSVVKRGNRQYIEVKDNGTGMTELVARAFFRLGDSQKLGKNKIGKFGLGSKVAILGIGNTCKVKTTPKGEPYAIQIHFDIQKFKDWNIKYHMEEAENEEHGTTIRIENVTIRIGNVKRFCERLQEQFSKVYKHFIDSGKVIIRINGEKVVTTPVDLIPGMYKEFDFKISSGKRVRGWAGAMKKAGVNWKFGFDLISNGRIIKANDLLSRQAHTSLARLTGEIHLDEFPTDVHKTDFLRDSHDFQEMQTTLIESELVEVMAKIAKLTNKEVFNKYHDDMLDVSKMLNQVIRSYDFLNHIDIDEGIFKKLKKKAEKAKERKEKLKEVMEDDEFNIFEELETFFDESDQAENKEDDFEEELPKEEEPKEPKRRRNVGLVINEPMGVSAGIDQPSRRWIVDETEDAMFLNVEVNLDHPTYQSEDEGTAVYMKNAVLDSVAEFILQEEKNQNGFMEDEIQRFNRIKDMLIRYSLAV